MADSKSSEWEKKQNKADSQEEKIYKEKEHFKNLHRNSEVIDKPIKKIKLIAN